LSQAVPQSNEVVRELKAFQAFAAFWSSVSNPFSLGLTSVSESISVRALTRSSRSRSVRFASAASRSMPPRAGAVVVAWVGATVSLSPQPAKTAQTATSMIARTQRPQRRIPTQISSKRGPS